MRAAAVRVLVAVLVATGLGACGGGSSAPPDDASVDREADTPEGATLLTVGVPYAGALQGTADGDVFAFMTEAGGDYQVSCSSPELFTPWRFTLQLPTGAGQVQSRDSESGVSLRMSAAVRVTFSLRAYDDGVPPHTTYPYPYTCRVFGGVDDAPDSQYEGPPRPLPLGVAFTGMTEVLNDFDLFALQAATGHHVLATCATGRTSPCDLSLNSGGYAPVPGKVGWTIEDERGVHLLVWGTSVGPYTLQVDDLGPDDRPGTEEGAARSPVAGDASFSAVSEVPWDRDLVAVETNWAGYQLTCRRAGAELTEFMVGVSGTGSSAAPRDPSQLLDGALVTTIPGWQAGARVFVRMSSQGTGPTPITCQGQLLPP